jgi:hypothetical protein
LLQVEQLELLVVDLASYPSGGERFVGRTRLKPLGTEQAQSVGSRLPAALNGCARSYAVSRDGGTLHPSIVKQQAVGTADMAYRRMTAQSANKVQTCPTPFCNIGKSGKSRILSNRAKSPDPTTPQDTPKMGS